jgi:hypothetical protein
MRDFRFSQRCCWTFVLRGAVFRVRGARTSNFGPKIDCHE